MDKNEGGREGKGREGNGELVMRERSARLL
jgi:hypothetical protein